MNAELDMPPLVVVTEYKDNTCTVAGQRFSDIRAVKAAFPLSLLLLGREANDPITEKPRSTTS